jgi:hypothetical protein
MREKQTVSRIHQGGFLNPLLRSLPGAQNAAEGARPPLFGVDCRGRIDVNAGRKASPLILEGPQREEDVI